MNGAIYRFCRKCGKQVNVSALEKYDKKYICPRCAGKPWYQTREGMVKDEKQRDKYRGACPPSLER